MKTLNVAHTYTLVVVQNKQIRDLASRITHEINYTNTKVICRGVCFLR